MEDNTRDFIKVSVSSLGLRICSKTSSSSSSSSSSLNHHIPIGFCEVKLPGFPVQSAPVPVVRPLDPPSRSLAASFYVDQHAMDKLVTSSGVSCLGGATLPCLEVVLYLGDSMVGVLRVPVSIDWWSTEVLHDGWLRFDKMLSTTSSCCCSCCSWELHAIIRAEMDPRYVFQFDGDIALSPQVVQLNGHGNGQQPVFSCKFSKERLLRNRQAWGGDLTPGRSSFRDKDGRSNERKGWLVTIHDLSGSPVAAASMVTPFVPFAGSDGVSKSNPGAWLILVPEYVDSSSWKAWGRLEAWRETHNVGLRLHLAANAAANYNSSLIKAAADHHNILVSQATLSSKKGGEFAIDTGRILQHYTSPPTSAAPTPQSSGDCSVYLGAPSCDEGRFVMRCQMRSRNKNGSKSSRRRTSEAATVVQLSARHVGCVEDAAVFVALAAAVDLCRDACQPFSRKLRKELCRD